MSKALTAVEKRDQEEAKIKKEKLETVRHALTRMAPQMEMALPQHLSVERLTRIALTAIQKTPKLLDCDRNSLFAAVMGCAQLGLEPDGILGQAYLVPFGGEVVFIPGYKGLITLARNSGDVVNINAQAVYEKDQFDYAYGLNERLEHTPSEESDRGEIKYFYAYAKFTDGGHHFEVMTNAQVEEIRNNSAGYKAKPKSSPWTDHYVEMGKKTAIRRIAKYLPLSVQKAAHIAASYDQGTPLMLDRHGELIPIAAPQEDDEIMETIENGTSKLDDLEEALENQEKEEEAPATDASDDLKLTMFKGIDGAKNVGEIDDLKLKYQKELYSLNTTHPEEYKAIEERIANREAELIG